MSQAIEMVDPVIGEIIDPQQIAEQLLAGCWSRWAGRPARWAREDGVGDRVGGGDGRAPRLWQASAQYWGNARDGV